MTRSRFWRHPLSGSALVAVYFIVGCGGGSLGEGPPPPQPDFSVSVTPDTSTINQGTTSQAIQISVQPLNGFSGSVQIALSGLPTGVSSNPQSPFSVPSGGSTTLLLGAASNTPAGSGTVTVRGTSGGLSHAQSLALTVQNGSSPGLPRATFVRTDSQALLDDPPGEPHRRHLAYDTANHHLFVANRARNRVEVLSTADGSRVTSLDASGASSVDLSADGRVAWVGTLAGQIIALDTAQLQELGAYSVAPLTPIPNTVFDRPEEVVALSQGKVLVRVRQAAGAESLLTLFDPSTGSMTDLTSAAPQVFQSGLGVMTRSSDHSRVLVTSNDGSGEAMVLDGSAAIVVQPVSLGMGTVIYAAADAAGSRFAVVIKNGSTEQLLLLDSSLTFVASRAVTAARGVVFSHDGQAIFVTDDVAGAAELAVFSSADLQFLGASADLEIQSVRSEIEETDETGLVFGLNNRGVSMLDATVAVASGGALSVLSNVPSVSPSTGPNTGTTLVTLTGESFGLNPSVYFGIQPAAAVPGAASTQVQAISPPNVASGAVNVTAGFADGSVVLAPDAFSYGPQILEVLPNAGKAAGGDTVSIFGYGFGEDSGKIAVKFGSAAGTVQKVETIPSFSPSAGLDPDFPFPLQRLTIITPAGTSGNADISISVPGGAVAAKRAFQFLTNSQIFSKAGFCKFTLYDQMRQWVYLSDIDHLDVFDLAIGNFRSGILPPGGPPPNALIRQAALTPDGSQLAVADFGAQVVYLINPDSAAGSKVTVGGIAGDGNSGPVRVAANSTNTIFVGLASYDTNSSGCTSCLQQIDLSAFPATAGPAPQPQVSALTSAPLVAASSDGATAVLTFAAAPGSPIAGWTASATGEFATVKTNSAASDVALAADGTLFATRNGQSFEIRGADLGLQSAGTFGELERIPQRTDVPGIAMHPSGALLYVPFLTGPAPPAPPFTGLSGGVDILDVHSGRLRLRVMLPEPLAMLSSDVDGLHAQFLTIDETGKRIFALTASGLSVVELARVPLGIGTISPALGPAAGGTTITVRGSGFQSGATATLGGKPVTLTFVDANTVKFVTPTTAAGAQQLTISNPDGESIQLGAAFTAH